MHLKRSLLIGTAALMLAGAVSAQERPLTHTVTYDDVSFIYPATLGTNLNVMQYAGDSPDLEQPGGPQPPYTQFQIYDTLDMSLEYTAPGTVVVYDTAYFADYPYYQAQLEALQGILADQPDLSQYMQYPEEGITDVVLPYLPVYAAGQVIRAQAHYVNSDTVQGIAYVTVYRQDASPFVNNEFIYTFQGVTADGSMYISARFPIVVPGIPAEIPQPFDYESFINTIGEYMNDTIAALNTASPDEFTPSLTELDGFISTINVEEAA